MDIIDVDKYVYSLEELVSFYVFDRLANYPVKSCREWLKDCTNAVWWCGSDTAFDVFVDTFEHCYFAYVCKICP